MLSDASVGSAYDAVAEQYTASLADNIATDPTERWIVEEFGRLCRESGNATIADLGCGPGRIAEHLARAGNRVRGVDVSAEMIRIARERSPELEFEIGSSASYLAARPDGVGHALLWFSTIHTAEFAELLATAAGAVRDGGYLLLGFLTTADPAAASEPYDHRVAPATRYSLAEVHRLLTGEGLTVLHLGLRAPGPGGRVHSGHALARKAG